MRGDGYVIEHRACLVPSALPDPNHYEAEPDTSAATLRRLAESFGYAVIDIDHIRRMFGKLAREAERREQELEGRVCEGCGYVARHHPTCRTEMMAAVLARRPYLGSFDARSGDHR